MSSWFPPYLPGAFFSESVSFSPSLPLFNIGQLRTQASSIFFCQQSSTCDIIQSCDFKRTPSADPPNLISPSQTHSPAPGSLDSITLVSNGHHKPYISRMESLSFCSKPALRTSATSQWKSILLFAYATNTFTSSLHIQMVSKYVKF